MRIFFSSNKTIFNKNTLKLSYSCTDSLDKIVKHILKKINHHLNQSNNCNSKIEINNDNELCNCRNSRNCPLKTKCLIESSVYRCIIPTSEQVFD